MSTWGLIAAFGAAGAVLRYLAEQVHALLHRAGRARAHSAGTTAGGADRRPIPWGVFTVNIAGSFLLGWVSASAAVLGGMWTAGLGAGLAGSLTTFSTFGTDLILLAGNDWRRFTAYLVPSIGFGLAAAAAGWALGLNWPG